MFLYIFLSRYNNKQRQGKVIPCFKIIMKKRLLYLFLAALIFLMLCVPLLLNTGCISKEIRQADSKDAQVDKDLARVTLEGIKIDTAMRAPVILLKEADGEKYLPIWIGSQEAYSIVMELEGIEAPRPLTHDLIVGLLEELNAIIDYIVISDIEDDIFYAKIYLRDGDNITTSIDSRPSDAIGLAVRVECDIFVKKDILDEHSIEIKSPDEQYMEI